MDHYSLLREFADSWVLLAMTGFFLGIILWAFRPGAHAKALHSDSAQIPFRHENAPAPAGAGAAKGGCDQSCDTCACKGEDRLHKGLRS